MTMFPTTSGNMGLVAMQSQQPAAGGLNAKEMQQLGMALTIIGGVSDLTSSYFNYKHQRAMADIQFKTQSEYRKRLHDSQMKAFRENYRRVVESVGENYKQIQQRIDQEIVSSESQIGAIQQQSKALQASSRAAAAERGVDQGDILIDAIAQNELRATEAVALEQRWRVNALEAGGPG